MGAAFSALGVASLSRELLSVTRSFDVLNAQLITATGSALTQSGGIFVSGNTFIIEFTISNYVSGSVAVSNVTPTTYRSAWSFFLVFNSTKFNNVFFKKGK